VNLNRHCEECNDEAIHNDGKTTARLSLIIDIINLPLYFRPLLINLIDFNIDNISFLNKSKSRIKINSTNKNSIAKIGSYLNKTILNIINKIGAP
jgi:hypothetical protein